MTEATLADKRLYKSTTRAVNIITNKGKTLQFKLGYYATRDSSEIEFLDQAIASNEFNGLIYIDPNARTLTAEQENPMLALRKKIIAEYLAEQAGHMNPENDMGDYTQGKLKAASTTDIAPVALGGDGAARLMKSAAALIPQMDAANPVK